MTLLIVGELALCFLIPGRVYVFERQDIIKQQKAQTLASLPFCRARYRSGALCRRLNSRPQSSWQKWRRGW